MTGNPPRIRLRPARLAVLILPAALAAPAAAQQIPLPVPPAARAAEAKPVATPPPPLTDTNPPRAGTAAVSATVSMDVLDNSRPLSRGDIVNLRIVEDRDPPVALQVTDAGDLDVPYIGRVRAEGKNPRALAFEIKSLLERDYYHQATVILALDVAGQRSPGRIYLSGAVNGAGPQEIPANERFTVSKAILRAGGFAEFANQRKVRVTRAKPDGTTDTMTVDVKEVIEKGRQDLDLEVLPNDFIVVPERLINF